MIKRFPLILALSALATLFPVSHADAQNGNWKTLMTKPWRWEVWDISSPEIDTMPEWKKEFMVNYEMEFTRKGIWKSMWVGDPMKTGTWELKGRTLTLIDNDGAISKGQIKTLTKNNLVFTINRNGNPMTFSLTRLPEISSADPAPEPDPRNTALITGEWHVATVSHLSFHSVAPEIRRDTSHPWDDAAIELRSDSTMIIRGPKTNATLKWKIGTEYMYIWENEYMNGIFLRILELSNRLLVFKTYEGKGNVVMITMERAK